MDDTSKTKKNKRDADEEKFNLDNKCDQCEYTGSRKALYKHRRSKHEGIRYPCDHCDYAATTPTGLRQHKESKHEGIRYPCDHCDYAATTATSLKQHTHTKHEGIRYPCDHCEYAATTKADLKRHKESKHLGVRYPCDQCEYSATTSTNLKVHKESKHDGIRYPCDQCGYAATQQSSLKSHKKTKHYEETAVANAKQNKSSTLRKNLGYNETLKKNFRTQNKVLEPEFMETNMNTADTEIKKREGTEEDPLSGTNILMDPLEDFEPTLKKEKIEDEDITVKEEIIDCDLGIEDVDDMK